jgi:hypothetical protein
LGISKTQSFTVRLTVISYLAIFGKRQILQILIIN